METYKEFDRQYLFHPIRLNAPIFINPELHSKRSPHEERELRRTKRTIYQSLLKRKDSTSYVDLESPSATTKKKRYIARQSKNWYKWKHIYCI